LPSKPTEAQWKIIGHRLRIQDIEKPTKQ
jgi:hypothetical protein